VPAEVPPAPAPLPAPELLFEFDPAPELLLVLELLLPDAPVVTPPLLLLVLELPLPSPPPSRGPLLPELPLGMPGGGVPPSPPFCEVQWCVARLHVAAAARWHLQVVSARACDAPSHQPGSPVLVATQLCVIAIAGAQPGPGVAHQLQMSVPHTVPFSSQSVSITQSSACADARVLHAKKAAWHRTEHETRDQRFKARMARLGEGRRLSPIAGPVFRQPRDAAPRAAGCACVPHPCAAVSSSG
jgi:hypothetical protein